MGMSEKRKMFGFHGFLFFLPNFWSFVIVAAPHLGFWGVPGISNTLRIISPLESPQNGTQPGSLLEFFPALRFVPLFCQAKCSPSSGCMNYTSAVFEWTIKFPGKTIWSHSSRSIAIGESVFQIAVVSYQSAREGPKYMWTMDWVPVAYIGWEISWVVGCWFLLSCSERWKASERAISGQCARGLPRRNGEERRRRAWEVWKIILCSKASKCRRIWPR